MAKRRKARRKPELEPLPEVDFTPFSESFGGRTPTFEEVAQWFKKHGLLDLVPPAYKSVVGDSDNRVLSQRDFVEFPEGSPLAGLSGDDYEALLNKMAKENLQEQEAKRLAEEAKKQTDSENARSREPKTRAKSLSGRFFQYVGSKESLKSKASLERAYAEASRVLSSGGLEPSRRREIESVRDEIENLLGGGQRPGVPGDELPEQERPSRRKPVAGSETEPASPDVSRRGGILGAAERINSGARRRPANAPKVQVEQDERIDQLKGRRNRGNRRIIDNLIEARRGTINSRIDRAGLNPNDPDGDNLSEQERFRILRRGSRGDLARIIANIERSRSARRVSRIDDDGLNENPRRGMSPAGRELVVREREQEDFLRGKTPKYVVVKGRQIELPKDFRGRKRFRTLLNQQVSRIKEDKKTEDQLRSPVGRAAFALGGSTRRGMRYLADRDRVFVPMVRGTKTRPVSPGGVTKNTPTNPLLRLALRARPWRKVTTPKKFGLMAAGTLASAALMDKIVSDRGEERLRQESNQRRARQEMLDIASREEYKNSLRESINSNLGRLRMVAPDLYARAAAGRILPQGAVVIGGTPRTDLLNELGMAMANGQFSQ